MGKIVNGALNAIESNGYLCLEDYLPVDTNEANMKKVLFEIETVLVKKRQEATKNIHCLITEYTQKENELKVYQNKINSKNNPRCSKEIRDEIGHQLNKFYSKLNEIEKQIKLHILLY